MKAITKALGIPYAIITSLYDKKYTEEHERCKMLNHLSYNKVLAIDSYSKFIECPAEIPNAQVAIKIQDDVMEPLFFKDSYAFLELNVPLSNKDVGLFKYNGKLFVRKFIIRKDKLALRAENKKYDDINLTEDSDFTIIGKVINSK